MDILYLHGLYTDKKETLNVQREIMHLNGKQDLAEINFKIYFPSKDFNDV